jgi:hypothetical protein
VGIDFYTSIPEQPPGESWYAGIGITIDPRWGRTYIYANARNKNTDYQLWVALQDAILDQWYNLRMDILTNEEDDKLKPTEIRLVWYINGIEKFSEIPKDSTILIDPGRTEFGPSRSFGISSDEASRKTKALLDNVKAVYRNRIS